MMDSSPSGGQRRRIALGILAVVAATLLGWFSATCWRIIDQAGHDEVRPASAIVVFGAAEYSGRPSPVFRARLDHAYQLYQQGVAPVVITTGGSGYDPTYSEGGVGRDYLIARGVPEHNLIAETQSSDTAQSAHRVGVIMRTNGMQSCLAVSDAYHVYRVKKMLESEGVTVYAAPRPDSGLRSTWQRATSVTHEAISFMLWRLHLT